jgi:hypothetical protein
MGEKEVRQKERRRMEKAGLVGVTASVHRLTPTLMVTTMK